MKKGYMRKKNNERGFTLLLAVIVSVIVLTIGLTVLNTTLKQTILSDIALESERSFHAAYAGVECAQFWNNADVWDVGTGTQPIRCVDQYVTTDNTAPHTDNADEVMTVEFDWTNADSNPGSGPEATTYEMCTQMTVYKYFDASAPTLMTILPIPDSDPLKTCNIGVECTVVVSRGFNRSCGNLTSVRTVEREVTVRF